MKEKREVGEASEKKSFGYQDTSPLTQRQFTVLAKGISPKCEYQTLKGKMKSRD